MKKIIPLLLILVIAIAVFAGCDNDTTDKFDKDAMTYAEYDAAALDAEVVIEAYVQATQSWWDNKITVYAQDEDGAYFLYEMACSQEDANKLTPGTKIKVVGRKAEWSGEVEIIDAEFKILDSEPFIADAENVTGLLGTDDLITHQNKFVSFKHLKIAGIEYKNGEPGDDIYVTVEKNGAQYEFCVERYLTDPDTDVYKAFADIKAGDIVDIEGFLYWYNGVNTHITSVDVKEPMTYAEYDAAELDAEVVIEAYVQATQSWWDNKITVYAQDEDGAYFLYEMPCTEADAAKLVPGTKILVAGYKTEWSGEVEIIDSIFSFVNDGDTYIATAEDVTSLLGTDDLIKHQNKFVSFKDMTIKSIEYKNGEAGDDIYVNLQKDGKDYSFCVERYLTDPDTDVYKAFADIKAGDIVDIEGFLYWYNGVNTHITSVTVK